ncbi:unnamed protein product [Lactuca virosa]|uniref:Uncharacterized protein n=1 Tax=Lactuca virosa TaxID=75947 RepID=A0AAU9MXP5_9ASTR|nr:unnamed protein product [Lactuca virosa]
MDVHTGNRNQENEDQNPGKDLEDANHAEDENHFVDEDTEVNIDFSEGQPHVTHDYVSPESIALTLKLYSSS